MMNEQKEDRVTPLFQMDHAAQQLLSLSRAHFMFAHNKVFLQKNNNILSFPS